jgi:pimeloyl-ACP methyl ester carboxylesterase
MKTTSSKQTAVYSNSILAERPGYFPVDDESLYTVLHEVHNPIARVLLVGPFASERHTSYRSWVQWARYLTAKNVEVLRYDYRGVGESTGLFEDMTLDLWMDDVHRLSGWFGKRGKDIPLILHGLELGALLAARTFDHGEADALILWAAPDNANQVLRSTLQRWIGPQQLLKRPEERRSPSQYFRDLEEGGSVEIEGNLWSAELWRRSLTFDLPVAIKSANDPAISVDRPVRIVPLGKSATPLVKGGVPGLEENKDFTWLFEPNYQWIASTIGVPVERS